ncbi:MAG TPA: M67 family metallopeptidase [Verrucomicrobiae bacterium]|nr:M67 family metallopeptidase [Verrucomicrobiae bacterium]
MKISRQLLTQIQNHLEAGYPNEACGVLLGKKGVVTETVSVDNQRTGQPSTGGESARNRYLIDPLVYVKIERDADKRRLDVLGIYHSHPDVPARPSQFDIDNAWPNLDYLIVSVVKGKAVESNCWRLRDDRRAFGQEPVEISG